MRLLITGNQGYIGPILTRLAKERGHHVVGLDIGYFEECIPAGQKDIPADDQILRDIRDVTEKDFDGIEAVIHLAGLSNDPLGEFNQKLTYDINLDATLRLARIAREAGVLRFVFASSCSIYGAAGKTDHSLDETAPFNPVSAYAISKVKSEQGLLQLADESFSPCFMRNATAFGVSPRMRFDLVLNNLVGWAHTTGTIRVLSDGTPWRPLVHIEDISQAALAAVEAPRAVVHNQAFNIGRSDANYQVRDIAQAVARTYPSAKLEITGEVSGDPRSYRVDFSKALTGLSGFAPTWTLQAGAEELARWLHAGSLSDNDFDSRLFIRLKQIKHIIATDQIDQNLRRIISPAAVDRDTLPPT
jgi:nucleoside-diphosphate-sugar epimerase